MPIHLPPISRREFLGRSIAAATGLVLGHELCAEAKPVDSDFWALLSDTHLAADQARQERGTNMAENLRIVSREVLSLAKRPAGVFITGDCAFNSGQLEDYGTLTELLQPMRLSQMPIHLALGNHDNRERFWQALREEGRAKRPLEDRQVAVLRTRRANWFILDSLETTLSTPGLLGRPQLEWLAKGLDANPHKPALVLIHHNPWLNGNLGLKDTPALLETIRPRKQVKAYIFGHTHTWKVTQDDSGIHLINLPPVAYVFRDGEPSGWVRATLQDEGMRLELRCVEQTHRQHGQRIDLHWRA